MPNGLFVWLFRWAAWALIALLVLFILLMLVIGLSPGDNNYDLRKPPVEHGPLPQRPIKLM